MSTHFSISNIPAVYQNNNFILCLTSKIVYFLILFFKNFQFLQNKRGKEALKKPMAQSKALDFNRP